MVSAALLLFLLVDGYLYGSAEFAAWTGQATQEAQILSKLARAPALASNADVILFGSSYVRSGMAGEPFWTRRLLPFNFGISGGGPLTSLFALKHVAPVIARRATRPWLILEIKIEALERADATLWSEYPQYLGMVRSRGERLAESPMLLPHFREYGMVSQFISSIVVPSGLYRSHAVQLFEHPWALDGYFYGMEDASGFSALYGVARPGQFGAPRRTLPAALDELFAEKIAEIQRFLDMARTLACPVALYSSPSPYLGADAAIYDHLFAALMKRHPEVTVLRTNEYGLDSADFDPGGHPNQRGSQKLAEWLIARLPIQGNSHTFDDRLSAAYEVINPPAAGKWRLATGVSAESSTAVAIDGTAKDLVLATLPAITVVPGREYVIEAKTHIERGELLLKSAWNRHGTGALVERSVATPSAESGADRIVLRIRPRHSRLQISIIDQAAASGGPPTRGRLEILRVWGDRS